MAKKITQPSMEDEEKLNDIIEDNKEELTALGRKWKVGYMKNGTKRKITNIMKKEKNDAKVNSKCAAVMLLNGYFKIFFLYWFVWRWFYYIKQYDDKDLLKVIEFCKKKVDVESYLIATILLTETRDTIMAMTREEVERIRQGSHGEQHGASQKNMDASQNP